MSRRHAEHNQPSSSGSSRDVNDLLHTLRGEHFRHAQNISGSRSHLRVSTRPRNLPTLPVSLAHTTLDGDAPAFPSGAGASRRLTGTGSGPFKLTVGAPAGPKAPRSWLARPAPSQDDAERDAAAWRMRAVAPALAHDPVAPEPPPVLPSLALLCLRTLCAVYADEPPAAFTEEVLPHLAPHLRKELVRDAAVRLPFGGARLASIYADDGGHSGTGADGEIVVIGPQATLRAEWLASSRPSSAAREEAAPDVEMEDDWDTKGDWDADANAEPAPPPLYTLVLLSAALPPTLLPTLPPTLTRLALLALPQPVPVHRLPSICPLLVLLDLSFNTWLGGEQNVPNAVGTLARVEWGRWARLKVLGVRECGVSEEVLARVNHSRWVDVEILR